MTELTALATELCTPWGAPGSPPKLVVNRENAVFDVRLETGERAALRLHRAGYQTADSILSELRWTERLASAGFPCPVPLRTQEGELLVQRDGAPIASLIRWIDAVPIADLNDEEGPDPELYHTVGALIGTLHNKTDQIELTGISRPAWSRETLLGERPAWGRFWENPALSNSQKDLLIKTRHAADDALKEMAAPDIGLIHADLLQENILQGDGGLWLIDFDDAGVGNRLYDLGTALIQHIYDARYDGFVDALLSGYEDSRGVTVKAGDLKLFVLLRGLASCGWIISRAAHDDPIHRVYADRAVKLSMDFQS